ncbi:MAG: serine hydrolase, partial [Desulfuromonadaceae bacterium]|nr:serine hydrolase [Desulfuromonadaceae bacterium]
MYFTRIISITMLFLLYSINLYADDLLDAGRATTIDVLIENAVRRKLIAGAVVSVGNHNGQLYITTLGNLYPDTASEHISELTKFDIASLTKVIATAPAIMKLLQQGRLNLLDPITRWFPEFEETDLDEITVLNLLTHTSGLNDIEISTDTPLQNLIEKVVTQKKAASPGNRFRYADINFI